VTPRRRTSPDPRVQEPRLSPGVSCSRCGFNGSIDEHNIAAARDGERSYTKGVPAKPARVGTIDGPWTADRMREIARGMAA
jgi:hypothetical protein